MNRAIQDIRALLDRLAPTKTPVLFLGETGAGKSWHARYLHDGNAENPGLFCRIAAKTLTPPLLAQILGRKPETLFFYEVTELSAEMQKKICLLSAEFPLRLTASSSVDPEGLADAGLFFPELYALLAAVSVVIPPLRSRIDDIIPLAEEFAAEFGAAGGKGPFAFSAAACEALKHYVWPENVLELRESVRFACAHAASGLIGPQDLRLQIPVVSDTLEQGSRSLKSAIDAFKKRYILEILAETRWNKTAAARILGIERTYLSRLIKELNI